ncbi:ParB/RepB/Spo0J family partition protein [Nitratireductor sp. StC3]|uniref:ParB/RepB/Spo0J family partition protein n=1 Tax=Nitratireductor sp. StC3 TaxID=2126741 RepID=UPI000D0CFF03|nr:ParB/RepB/Spo0J family partition protein [Nitratireductor sp. StC3]PSM19842.1 plasmid stabilization protein [Nitratireductor sp. StC3]
MTTTQNHEQTVPLGRLVPGRFNVRRVNGDAGKAALAASIEAHGLIQNLVVRKAAKGSKFEVVAGGRRLGALRQLLKDGRSVDGVAVDKDYPVRVVVQEEGNDTELSLAENVQREAMHPVDEVVAYRELVDGGMAVEDIAARFGQSVVTVRQRLKLASLSPRILDEMRDGNVTLEQAKALAITDDHAAQEAAWFERDGWSRTPANLRAQLTSDHVRPSERLVRFVGMEAYEQAGGTVLRDLFGEDGDTYLTDRDTLVRLANNSLQLVADELRDHGWKWVEVSLDANILHQGGFGRIHPVRRALTEAENAELAELSARFDELADVLEGYAEGDPDIAVTEAQQVEVEQRIEAIRNGTASYQAEEQALSGCLVGIAYDGTLQVVRGVVKPEDRKALAALHAEGEPGDGSVDERQEPETRGMSAALVEELTAVRTAALRVVLANKPEVALAALLHPLVAEVFHPYHVRIGSAVEVRGQRKALEPSVKEPDACEALKGWLAVVEPWGDRIPGDSADLWPWLLAQDMATLTDLLAVVTAANLNGVEARHDASPARLAQAAQVAEAVALDMKAWWTPQETFLSRLSKADIAEAMREAGCPEDVAKAVEKAPKVEAVVLAVKALDGKGWLPPVLRNATDEVQSEAA